MIDQHKDVIFTKGPIENLTFFRLAMKPIQAIQVFEADIVKKYSDTMEKLLYLLHRNEAKNIIRMDCNACQASESQLRIYLFGS